jgi:hypothetical protein
MRSEKAFMSANGCCKVAARESGQETTEKRILGSNRPRPTFVRRFLENAGWIVPGAILALLPKCPACVVTYAVVGTGVGLSLSATTYLRTLLVVLCVTSLLFLAARRVRQFATMIFTTQAKNKYEHSDKGIRSIAGSFASTSISYRSVGAGRSRCGSWDGRGGPIGTPTTKLLSMHSATSEHPNSLTEEIPIGRRDRIRLLTAALATQVELGAVSRSPDNRSEHALDRAINLCEMQI